MRKTNSGYQDITLTPSGNYRVVVMADHLGTFKEILKAVEVRDDYRVKNHLPKALY